MANAFAQRADLNIDERRLIELTDTEDARGVVDEGTVTRELERGAGRIAGYIKARYVVPDDRTTVDDPILRDWNAIIGKRLLYDHRESMELPAGLADDYKLVMKALEAIAADAENSVQLSLAPKNGASEQGPASGALGDQRRIFGRDKDSIG